MTTQPTPRRLYTTEQAADYLGLSPRTLSNWRYIDDGQGPRVTPVGRAVRYDLQDLDAWIEAQKSSTR